MASDWEKLGFSRWEWTGTLHPQCRFQTVEGILDHLVRRLDEGFQRELEGGYADLDYHIDRAAARLSGLIEYRADNLAAEKFRRRHLEFDGLGCA